MTATGTYKNKNLKLTVDGKEYTVDVSATAEYYYQPCVMYFKDGTGQPEIEELEINEWSATWYDSDGNEVYDVTGRMEDELNEFLYDSDEWVFPEEPEPECDWDEED